MERLTKREGDFAHYPKCFEKCNGDPKPEKCVKCDVNKEIVDCLSAYEDTGLTPEEIAELKERRWCMQGGLIFTTTFR